MLLSILPMSPLASAPGSYDETPNTPVAIALAVVTGLITYAFGFKYPPAISFSELLHHQAPKVVRACHKTAANLPPLVGGIALSRFRGRFVL